MRFACSLDSTKSNDFRLPLKASSRACEDDARDPAVSSRRVKFFSNAVGSLFAAGKLPVGFQHKAKRFFEICASFFKRFSLSVDTRDLFHVRSPPAITRLKYGRKHNLSLGGFSSERNADGMTSMTSLSHADNRGRSAFRHSTGSECCH